MTRNILTIFFSILFFVSSILSQEVPPINIFSTEDYGAENQNWSISQGENKFIYVANNKGLLEFNGETWQLYPTPNETIMRSVYFFKQRVYTGFYMDFGFWERNEVGQLTYTSLIKSSNLKMLEDEQIWEIEELEGWLLFKSLQRIYLYNLETKEFKKIDAERDIIKLKKVDNSVYFQELGKGVFKIENGKPKIISDNINLKNNRIVEVFAENNNLLFLTQKNGFYLLKDNVLQRWNSNSNNILSKTTIYSAIRLKNKNFALGTISNGLLYLNSNGSLNYKITQGSGLSNNTILSVFEDVDNNLWLGLDNGINNINLRSPFKLFLKKDNFWGTIYASIVYKNNLYLGTNQGLYFRKLDSSDNFELIENTEGQVWNLQNIHGELFCSHDTGTFKVDAAKATLIQNTTGAWGLEKIDNETLLLGTYNGLYIIKKNNGGWFLNNKIEGFSNSSRYILIVDKNRIFVNHEYKGVFKLKVDDNYTKVIEIQKDTSVEKGIHSSLIEHENTILYSSKKGVFRYDKKEDKFKIDTIYSKLMTEDNFLSAKLISDAPNNKLWSFTKNDIRYLTPGKLSNTPEINKIPLKGAMHKGASGYENIINLKDKEYLIGTSDGYLKVDLKSILEPKDFKVYLTKVYNSKLDREGSLVNFKQDTTFASSNNNFVFYYSIPNYNKTSAIEYQYILEGFNKKWISKTQTRSFLVENLPAGNYTFKVKGVIDSKESENIAEFSFSIDPAWYLSNFFKVLYIAAFFGFIFILNYFTRRYYKNQREKIIEKNKRELELRELETSQEIIKLNNEKLKTDIENKNKELATSTMSIIKKNEFLNTIKEELVSGNRENIDKVVKIINKNLNNTDDWKMFQEAFNNADKDFIKKMKSLHPQLTPNDLRLCAYLRLNLSSKEIAPLLNISPRSVEVKRYRLRKKMNLSHDDNLTDYIIGI